MLNLLQSGVCGNESVTTVNGGANAHFLTKNLQHNEKLRSDQYDETMKIEQMTNGDRIAFIKIRDDLPSPTSAKTELHRRTQNQRYFFQKYPDFFRQYCMCLHRKIEPNPDDLNSESSSTDDKYGANGFLLNRTPIIPITVDPQAYVSFSLFPTPIIHKCLFVNRMKDKKIIFVFLKYDAAF